MKSNTIVADAEPRLGRDQAIAGLPAGPAQALGRLLAERYSCRSFLPDPVPRATIESILRMAQLSASWCNSQPWEMFITEGEATERFRSAMYDHAAGQPPQALNNTSPDLPFPDRVVGRFKARQRACGWGLYESVGIKFGDRDASFQQALKNFSLFGAPHVAIVTSAADLTTYGAIDTGGYVANFMLAAHAMGVGTVAQAALAGYAPLVRELLNIPDDQLIVCGISFGFADPADPANGFRSNRADLAEVVHWRSGDGNRRPRLDRA